MLNLSSPAGIIRITDILLLRRAPCEFLMAPTRPLSVPAPRLGPHLWRLDDFGGPSTRVLLALEGFVLGLLMGPENNTILYASHSLLPPSSHLTALTYYEIAMKACAGHCISLKYWHCLSLNLDGPKAAGSIQRTPAANRSLWGR
jgi:hypothetical protein